MQSITSEAVERHIRVLADDNLEGRAPGTEGFEGASLYVESELQKLGLTPMGLDGTFRQSVPLQESIVNEPESGLSMTVNNEAKVFSYAEDFTLSPNAGETEVTVTGEVVFVGYGVSAPELGYDDYADIGVTGKVVLYLSGSPAMLPSTQRAYYSSGAVKSQEASERGAVGIMSFTYPEDPRFRWEVGVARSRRGGFAWLDENGSPRGRNGNSPILGSANLNHSLANALFENSSVPIEAVFSAAAENTPQAFDLDASVTMKTNSRHRMVSSHNLIAKMEGADPELKEEHVVYVAHIDHFGIGAPDEEGDEIYNGAHDNASGTSIVLEVARAYSELTDAPRRSVLFLFVTAEEWGLLGSDYFVNYPTVPKSSLVANMSLDMPFLYHPLLDIVPYGAEHSSLNRAVTAATKHMGISIGPDPIPEQVLFIRSDHYSFVRQGIPALFIKSGFETGDERDGGAMNSAFRTERYHTPNDEIEQGFDFGAGVSHAQVNFLTGYYVAMEDNRPTWNEGDFFGKIFGGQ
ncbi:MAG TPA: M28 family peptidase [Gemmatimonadetes bacterium]|nr:M28 family peptidase [Gemmatimonadota bacterium]